MVVKYTSFDRSTKLCDYYHCSVVDLQFIELHEKKESTTPTTTMLDKTIESKEKPRSHTRSCVCMSSRSMTFFFVGRC